MNYELRKPGFTLVELLVVIIVIALLVAIAIPSARAIKTSYESTGAEAMITSALASARAIAAKEHCYAGVRFQKAYDAAKPVVDQPQYIIFIINDQNATGLAPGFRAVEGLKPVKLPDNMGVMDLQIRRNWNATSNGAQDSNSVLINADGLIDEDREVTATTTFSIVFSPTGKMIISQVRVRNKNGFYQPNNDSSSSKKSYDEVFNSPYNITTYQTGVFVQDDYADIGLGAEMGRSSFVIYDKDKFKAAYSKGTAWWDYLRNLPVVHINQYTGTIIEK